MRFRVEIETSLGKDELNALKQGHEEVLAHILDDPLSEEDQLKAERDSDTDRGPTH